MVQDDGPASFWFRYISSRHVDNWSTRVLMSGCVVLRKSRRDCNAWDGVFGIADNGQWRNRVRKCWFDLIRIRFLILSLRSSFRYLQYHHHGNITVKHCSGKCVRCLHCGNRRLKVCSHHYWLYSLRPRLLRYHHYSRLMSTRLTQISLSSQQ
jgi:hypothetical protein